MTANCQARLTIEVYDAAGKLVGSDVVDATTGMELRLGMGGNPAGVYMLRVSADDKTETHRLYKK